MDNQQRPTYSIGNSAQCYAAGWMGGEFGGEWMCVCVCVCDQVPLIFAWNYHNIICLIGYMPIQNKKLKKKTQEFQYQVLWRKFSLNQSTEELDKLNCFNHSTLKHYINITQTVWPKNDIRFSKLWETLSRLTYSVSFALRGAICWFVSSFHIHTFCINANLKVMWKQKTDMNVQRYHLCKLLTPQELIFYF